MFESKGHKTAKSSKHSGVRRGVAGFGPKKLHIYIYVYMYICIYI